MSDDDEAVTNPSHNPHISDIVEQRLRDPKRRALLRGGTRMAALSRDCAPLQRRLTTIGSVALRPSSYWARRSPVRPMPRSQCRPAVEERWARGC